MLMDNILPDSLQCAVVDIGHEDTYIRSNLPLLYKKRIFFLKNRQRPLESQFNRDSQVIIIKGFFDKPIRVYCFGT